MKPSMAKVTTRVRKLAQIADELRSGANFPVTRMTTVKGLCEDPEAAARFALHLAGLTRDKMAHRCCPDHIEPAKWSYYRALATSAVRQMESYLEGRTGETAASLRALLSEIEEAQSQHKYLEWGPVRTIESEDLLLVENALRCVLSSAPAYWGYRVAKEYTERYEPRYGTGLIPASAPMVEEIAKFWCQYHFGMPLSEWLAASSEAYPRYSSAK